AEIDDDRGWLQSPAFSDQILAGLIVVDHLPPKIIDRIRKLDVPTIWLDANVWEPYNCIRRDEKQAGEVAAHYLIQQGATTIVWLGSPSSRHFSLPLRFQGVSHACRTNAIPCIEMKLDYAHHESVTRAWEDAITELMQHHPKPAIAAYDSYYAQRFITLAGFLGYRAGKDYHIVTCDGTQMLHSIIPELPAVPFPRQDMGRLAAEKLLSILPSHRASPPAGKFPSILIPATMA
ncbi:MAG: LacI family transcriptional regulator, partial [Lentisphaerae bacterium]